MVLLRELDQGRWGGMMETEIDGIQTDNYLDELQLRVSARRMTSAARQRIAYMYAEMEDRDGDLRSKGNTACRHHCM